MDKKNFYTVEDSSKVFLWAMLLPQIVSLVFAFIFASIYSTTEEMQSSFLYIFVACILAQACFAFILFYYNKKEKIAIKPATKFNTKISIKNILVCMLISVVAVFGFVNFVSLANNFFAWLGFSSSGLAIPDNTFGWFVFNVVFVALLPAIFEEFIFRGIIYNGLRSKGFWFASIISALMFALIHLSIEQFVFPIVMGLVFALILEKTGSILYTMITHFCNNFIVVLISYIATFTGRDMATLDTTSWLGAVLAIVIAIVAGIIIWVLIKYVLKKQQSTEVNLPIEDNENQQTQVVVNSNKKYFTIALIVGVLFWIFMVVSELFI